MNIENINDATEHQSDIEAIEAVEVHAEWFPEPGVICRCEA